MSLKTKVAPRLVSLAIAWVVGSGAASATDLVVNCSTASGPTELTAAAVTCGQFNLPGATLTSIAITITGGITGSITLTNGDASPQTGVGTTSTEFSAGPLTGFTFVNPLVSVSFGTGSQPLAGSQTLTFGGLASPNVSAPPVVNTTSFAPYTGAGFFDIFISTATSYAATGSGGFPSFAQSTQAQATAVVTYTYTAPAPPP